MIDVFNNLIYQLYYISKIHLYAKIVATSVQLQVLCTRSENQIYIKVHRIVTLLCEQWDYNRDLPLVTQVPQPSIKELKRQIQKNWSLEQQRKILCHRTMVFCSVCIDACYELRQLLVMRVEMGISDTE
ncbi:Hypothetical_protein [Hexamita inflata]|uniref:Hypothetical_protein n=1 Tax=Hexamita inflata TaxID=28002 RepID=A0AA86RMW1_9EUKA|nr:Hypothetical protein HINF_LOCUS64133 [Hexamita inflata]